MCLSIPSKVIKIDKELNTATVDTMGVSRDASLDLMEEGSVKIGDYVLLYTSLQAFEDVMEIYKLKNSTISSLKKKIILDGGALVI